MKSYKKFDEKAQTAKITVFARGNLLLEHRFLVLKCGENLSLQSHPEKIYIGFFAQIFFGSLYASKGLRKKILRKNVNVKFFTVDPYTPCNRVSRPFPIWSIWQIWPLLGQKNMFFGGLVKRGNQI